MSHANRGMGLEHLIELSNTIYRNKRWAVVTKRPTPVKIIRTAKNGRVEGHLERASTVDYDGIYRGRALVFEAKSTKEQHRFPLANFHEHQVEYMRACKDQGAISFAIIEFVKHQTIFFVPFAIVAAAWDKAKAGGAKSIPFDDLNYSCHTITSDRGVPIDYLAILDKLFEKGGTTYGGDQDSGRTA